MTLAIGGMTREELMSRMSEPEFRWWLAYDRVEPLPDAHWDAALIASTVAQPYAKKKLKLDDFLPRKGRPKADRGAVLGAMGRIRDMAERADAERERREG